MLGVGFTPTRTYALELVLTKTLFCMTVTRLKSAKIDSMSRLFAIVDGVSLRLDQ